MSVLTFQLTKAGLKGYELDYDNVEKYYEPQNDHHASGRVQRVEEADQDWQQAYGFAAQDLIVRKSRTVHDYQQWKDVDEYYYAPGEMKTLDGHALVQECIQKICKQFDAKYGGDDKKYVDDFCEAFARVIANCVANQKLGMELPTWRLLHNRCLYCMKRVMGERLKETMCDFEEAIYTYCEVM